ncbi:YigZ family protein [Clostridium tyrobutyricum]|uniref:YigZ family protein n=1 Tax=Clostridium tyrobutyricum TaxID=1519 RepID=UPI001C37EAD1|nr:YigZ family protein [Clostridium tyrobutyricum]MBV4418292.1 YigZ family protein [Clostridium tyrobutyricum]
MGYFTVKNESRYEFEEKKSTFIGRVRRIYSEDEAKKFINKIKRGEKEARHNVYAYAIGENMNIQRYSDDGEPQGTAGLPILGIIKKNKITDVVVVVTRYFGGILLGKGGLLRAYSKAASKAIEDSGIIEKIKGVELDIMVNYEDLDKIKHGFENELWHIENIDYSDKVKILMYCPLECNDKVINKTIDITRGKCQVIVGDEEDYFKMENRLYREEDLCE